MAITTSRVAAEELVGGQVALPIRRSKIGIGTELSQ